VWFLVEMHTVPLVWGEALVVVTSGGKARPEVALTFDDGPSPRYTPQVLSLLKQYQAKGTFFVLGRKAEEHPGLITAMLEEGHEVGNHTHSHPHLPQIDHLTRIRELEWTRLALDLLGCPNHNRIMRPPYSE
jgi:peptidoglycan/xylan/chitin deacetylase (PgdA/CDA1 family)